MKWISNYPKKKKRWWLGEVGYCQECGHRKRKHLDMGIVKFCQNGCPCELYQPLPEHDWSKDMDYDPEAYGRSPKVNRDYTQRNLTGMTHDQWCENLISKKRHHGGCVCQCH